MKQLDVIGLGVSTIDVLSLVEHFPQGEEVQRAAEITVQGGGPVATAIFTLARLGARVAMVDTIGDDWRGRLIRDEFAREGVNVDSLLVRPGCTSSTASILVRQADGARAIVYAPGSAGDLNPQDLTPGLVESARFLHVNGRHWEACLEAAHRARRAGVQISFDGGAHRYRPELRQLLPLADLCIVARTFAEEYTGVTGDQAVARLLDAGPGLVVITDGVHGSWIYPRQGPSFHQPAYLLPTTVDTTGCGDSYHGAFLYGLLQGWPLERTAALASAVAALNSRRLGGRAGLPTLGEAEGFMSCQSPGN